MFLRSAVPFGCLAVWLPSIFPLAVCLPSVGCGFPLDEVEYDSAEALSESEFYFIQRGMGCTEVNENLSGYSPKQKTKPKKNNNNKKSTDEISAHTHMYINTQYIHTVTQYSYTDR